MRALVRAAGITSTHRTRTGAVATQTGALAFGAAIGGASLLGVVGAILALPAAAMAQAIGSQWGTRYDVLDSHLTRVDPPRRRRRRRDGLDGDEASFGICTYWLAHALALGGDLDRRAGPPLGTPRGSPRPPGEGARPAAEPPPATAG